MTEMCGNCRFTYKFPGSRICRRHPPAVYWREGMLTAGKATIWPEVNDVDWCGEYEPVRAIAEDVASARRTHKETEG